MIPNFKTDAKMLAKTLLQIVCILLVFSVIFYGLLSYIVGAWSFTIGSAPNPTESTVEEWN